MDDLSLFCCQNPGCPDHGHRGHGYLTVTARYGPGKSRRMLRCRTCKARFSERKGTPLFDSRLPAGIAGSVLAHVAEGVGTRKAGGHAAELHEQLVAFPPKTTEVRFDEKWSFVGCKEKNRPSEDERRGDRWDHTALDPRSRPVVGKRGAESVGALVEDFSRRACGRVMRLMNSDEYRPYPEAIRAAYGEEVTPPRMGCPGRPANPRVVLPPGLTYATVHKQPESGRVVKVTTRIVFGTALAVVLALIASAVSRAVNTCFVERHNGTDRNRCSRKARKSYAFSKDWEMHRSATMFSHFSYNFCWPVRTLRERTGDGRWRRRSPAMAAGLTDHVRTIAEWLAFPIVQRRWVTTGNR